MAADVDAISRVVLGFIASSLLTGQLTSGDAHLIMLPEHIRSAAGQAVIELHLLRNAFASGDDTTLDVRPIGLPGPPRRGTSTGRNSAAPNLPAVSHSPSGGLV